MTPKVYRLEVSRQRQPDWAFFVRLARRMPGYRVAREDGLELHVVETTSLANLAGLHELVRGWKAWAFFVDGVPATRRALADLLAQRHARPPKPPPPPKKSKEEKLNEKVVDEFLDGWSAESWEEMREQLGAATHAEARQIMRTHYLSVLKRPRRRGPDPKLGF